jgi:Zn-dependent peptidase ImmA (M78 family)
MASEGKKYRIPRYVDLPFGYEVEIKQLGRKAFQEECGSDCYAQWEVSGHGGTIYLDKSRDIKKRRADLAHELGHALLDWQARILGGKQADAKD